MTRRIGCVGLLASALIMAPGPSVALQKGANHGSRQSQTHEQSSNTPSAAIQRKTSQRSENPSSESVNSSENPQAVRLVSVPPVTVRKGWAALAGLGISVVLAIVGIVGVIVAVCTVLTINEQVSVTARSARAAEKAARAAQQSADAALLNAQAVMKSERAWVLSDIELAHNGLVDLRSQDSDRTAVTVRWTIHNQGKTPAWITERRICFRISDEVPRVPDLEDHNTDVVVERLSRVISAGEQLTEELPLMGYGRMHGTNAKGVIFGVVRYRDIFDMSERSTNFGYQVFSRIQEIERLRDYPAYNQNA